MIVRVSVNVQTADLPRRYVLEGVFCQRALL